jgi:hypothetical protein
VCQQYQIFHILPLHYTRYLDVIFLQKFWNQNCLFTTCFYKVSQGFSPQYIYLKFILKPSCHLHLRILEYIYGSSHAYCMPHPSRPSSFDQTSNINYTFFSRLHVAQQRGTQLRLRPSALLLLTSLICI